MSLHIIFFCSEDEDDDLQYADHDYEVPQQKGLKKLWNRVKWTRDEVVTWQNLLVSYLSSNTIIVMNNIIIKTM